MRANHERRADRSTDAEAEDLTTGKRQKASTASRLETREVGASALSEMSRGNCIGVARITAFAAAAGPTVFDLGEMSKSLS